MTEGRVESESERVKENTFQIRGMFPSIFRSSEHESHVIQRIDLLAITNQARNEREMEREGGRGVMRKRITSEEE